MHKAVIVLIISFFIGGCTIKDKKPQIVQPEVIADAYLPFYNQIKEGKTVLRDGDLIVRSGNDMTSQLIKSFNKKDKSYSHAGIVFFNNGEPYIYHILAGFENPDAKLVFDSLDKFCHPRHNSGYAIYRYSVDSTEIGLMKATVLNWHNQGIRFDSTFDLKSDDKMYCSEMISKALSRSTKNRIKIETIKPSKAEATLAATRLPLTIEYITKLNIIPVDNLYMNSYCRLIQRFDFTNQKQP